MPAEPVNLPSVTVNVVDQELEPLTDIKRSKQEVWKDDRLWIDVC